MSGRYSRQEVVTWESRLQKAYSADDVVSIVRDFLATWGPQEIAALPEHLRPRKMRDSDDVGLYAFRLVSRPGAGSNAHIMLRMTTFFTAASQRLSEIYAVAAAEARARANEDAAS